MHTFDILATPSPQGRAPFPFLFLLRSPIFRHFGQQIDAPDPFVDGPDPLDPGNHANRVMVAQIFADAGQAMQDRHADVAQQVGWPDTGNLQQLRRIDRAAAHDNLAPGLNLGDRTAPAISNAGRALPSNRMRWT